MVIAPSLEEIHTTIFS